MRKRKTPDQIAKEFGDRDYHSEKLVSGSPKGDYVYAISGKKGKERYSKQMSRSEGGKNIGSVKTRTLKGKGAKKTTTSWANSRETKPGVHHIQGKTETKSSSKRTVKKKSPAKRKVTTKRKTKKK